MFRSILLSAALLMPTLALAASPRVVIDTTMGKITVQLNEKKAPITVKNFLSYVKKKAYDGTIFHRVIPGFVIQGGGLTPALKELPAGKPIHNEAANGLKNVVGTIAMARQNAIDSATRQFYINTGNNYNLDHTSQSCTRKQMQSILDARKRGLYKPMICKTYGYAVFGHVVAGMNVVRKIEHVPTHSVDGMDNVPVKPVIIKHIREVSQ